MTFVEKFLMTPINLESMFIEHHNKESQEWRYPETPIGSIVIAHTGVDGCHYCVVPKQGVSIDEAPIYFVSPMDWDDTVVWVAKNIIDFVSIGVALGSFTYIASFYSCDEEEFLQFVEESWDEHDENEKKEAIKLLKECFPIKQYNNLFQHIVESYQDKRNHVDLDFEFNHDPEFESVKIHAVALGRYSRG